MKILVINTGSSTIKYQLFDMETERVLSRGLCEKIGENQGLLTHIKLKQDGNEQQHQIESIFPNHYQGLKTILKLLTDKHWGVISHKHEIDAIGHRVVHGGEYFKNPIMINEEVIKAIKANIPLAPLHNPANITGIEVLSEFLPNAPQAAVFDTAFHQTISPQAFLYAIPHHLYETEKIRRYGFHGTSHQYVAVQAAAILEQPLDQLKMITVHLGNGASITAIDQGQSVDTSMGMTPLEGLVMGSRSGDIDPAIPFFMARHLMMENAEIEDLLYRHSGLKGLCNSNDMREVISMMQSGNHNAITAFHVYCYRIKKYIGAYYAVLGRLDALVFTAGIGENSADVRKTCTQGLEHLGIILDQDKNLNWKKFQGCINSNDSRTKVLVIPTNEELMIARESLRLMRSLNISDNI